MEKEKFEEGNYYNYEGVLGYAYACNKLVLENGLLVKRTMGKYSPDVTTYGSLDKNGYLRTKIKGRYVFIHRLVATHFVENPNSLSVVDHINENKEDNRKENLRWVTLETNTSRTNIREHRALNQAKELYNAAKEKEAIAKAYYESVEKEKEDIELQYKKLAYMKELMKKELDEKVLKYAELVDELIKIANKEVGRKEQKKLDTLKKDVRTRKEMIEEVGKQIRVNGVVYPSIRSAARFIVAEERRSKGRLLNTETVRKELKRIQTGVRSEGLMYEVYKVSRI